MSALQRQIKADERKTLQLEFCKILSDWLVLRIGKPKELARECGIHYDRISAYRRGKRWPSVERCYVILAAMGRIEQRKIRGLK